MYDHYNFNLTFNYALNNGYISYIDIYYYIHILIPTSYGFDNLPFFTKKSSYLLTFDAFDISNETLTNHSMSTQTILSVTVSNYEYIIERNDTRSFILSLPETLNHSLTVSPGQTFNFDFG